MEKGIDHDICSSIEDKIMRFLPDKNAHQILLKPEKRIN